uniref:ATP synthase F0 subunit 6 n=1 Tax=Aleurodicus rugioperculatus TaxID=1608326 RepID=UPI00286A73BE|nr:ATP synthase F0 subunit 6 [Aleurodicus rugioperculatus]WKT15074.1 ATP synthase F0 subunit 6 [Aleurodicus rugioperculatus]
MMTSLFEIYDPYTFYLNLSLNWFVILFFLIFMFMNYWLLMNNYFFVFNKLMMMLFNEFKMFYSSMKIMKGCILMFLSLFFYLLFINLMGLIPYVFSITSHLVFSLSMSLTFWLTFMFFGWFNFTNKMFSHLIPLGTPMMLIFLMVLIETISNMIRPISLSVRLMSNMISGHLLMSLLGNCSSSVFLFQMFLYLFEFFVCFIQAYVFSSLLTLYFSEI